MMLRRSLRRTRTALALASIAASATVARADYLIVDDDGGPGVDHTTISAACQAASHGDVILVHAGVYPQDVNTGKGVAIIGLEEGVRLTGSLSFNSYWGHVSLANLEVHRLRLWLLNWGATVQDLRTLGPEDVPGEYRPHVLIDRCYSVLVSGCDLRGLGEEDDPSEDGTVLVRESTVEIVDSTIFGPTHGRRGFRAGVAAVDSSFVGIHRSSVFGGEAPGAFLNDEAGPAVYVDASSSVMITGRPGDTIRGQDAFLQSPTSWNWPATPGVENYGSVRVSGVTVEGGDGDGSYGPASPVEGTGDLTEPAPADSSVGIELDTTYSLAGDTSVSGTMTLNVTGEPGDAVRLAVGRRPSVRYFGADDYPLLTQPYRAVVLGVIAPDGELTVQLAIPPGTRVGDRYVFQGLVGAGTDERFTNSLPIRMR